MNPLILIPADGGILSKVQQVVEHEGFGHIIRSLELRALSARSAGAHAIDATRLCSGSKEIPDVARQHFAEAYRLEEAANELRKFFGGEHAVYSQITTQS